MNICLLSTEYPPETGWGGIGTHTYELAHGLSRAGARVIVLTRSVEDKRFYEDQGVRVYRIPPLRLDRRIIWRTMHIWDGYNLAVALKLREIVARHGIHIVEAPEFRGEAFFAQMMPGRTFPVVVRLHGGTYKNRVYNRRPLRTFDRVTIFMERVSVHRADLVISPSQALIEFNRCPGGYLRVGQNAVVVRNPIDSSRFCRSRSGTPLLPLDQPYVLFVGRLEENKGIKALLEAMIKLWKKHPAVKLVMVGADAGLGQSLVRSLPAPHRNEVIRIGHIPREELSVYYHHATVCVFPSLWENFPYTCLEAMVSGTPVVAGKNGGMVEMVEDGISGFLISPDDGHLIADRILRLIEDTELRQRMAGQALRTVQERFDVQVVVDQTLRVYQDVISIWKSRIGERWSRYPF